MEEGRTIFRPPFTGSTKIRLVAGTGPWQDVPVAGVIRKGLIMEEYSIVERQKQVSSSDEGGIVLTQTELDEVLETLSAISRSIEKIERHLEGI